MNILPMNKGNKSYDYSLEDFEGVLRALPEVVSIDGYNYALEMGKTGDGSGRQSRYYVGYVNKYPADDTFCWYEETSLHRAANKALGKIHGFRQ